LLLRIEAACKDEAGVEDGSEDAESLPVVWKNGTEYWVPDAKKFVKLDLSATSLAVYSDRDNDGIYDGYNDNDNDNDDYDGAGVFVFDPRNPVHKVENVGGSRAPDDIVYHEPYGYVYVYYGDIIHPCTGESYITELTLPDKATAIAGSVAPDLLVAKSKLWTATFAVFTRLAKVTANGVEIINDYAFYGCGYALAEASFPKVERIGFRAFERCEALTRLFLPADPPGLFVPARYPGFKSNLFNLRKKSGTESHPWKQRDDTLFIYVNGDEAEVDAYVAAWKAGTASVGASNTEVYGYLEDYYTYYHMPVTIEKLAK
jgi:hypothetical protein